MATMIHSNTRQILSGVLTSAGQQAGQVLTLLKHANHLGLSLLIDVYIIHGNSKSDGDLIYVLILKVPSLIREETIIPTMHT